MNIEKDFNEFYNKFVNENQNIFDEIELSRRKAVEERKLNKKIIFISEIILLCIVIILIFINKDKNNETITAFAVFSMNLMWIIPMIIVLIKRKELIKESEKIIKDVVKTEKEIYSGLSEINNKNMNMMELDRKLLIHINEFHLIKDKYQKLQKNTDFQKISFAITETEDQLNAYKDYYNDNAGKYNKLIKQFPIILITLLKRRKEKLFFDKKSSNDNDYNDFKY